MNTPETMAKHDFSDLTPPPELVAEWWSINCSPTVLAVKAARWGAEQAAERLKGQWPKPITDRPPTEADGDGWGYVQFHNGAGWGLLKWHLIEMANIQGWLHTPRWQPPAPPTLKEQALAAMSRASFTSLSDYELIRRALEADS